MNVQSSWRRGVQGGNALSYIITDLVPRRRMAAPLQLSLPLTTSYLSRVARYSGAIYLLLINFRYFYFNIFICIFTWSYGTFCNVPFSVAFYIALTLSSPLFHPVLPLFQSWYAPNNEKNISASYLRYHYSNHNLFDESAGAATSHGYLLNQG